MSTLKCILLAEDNPYDIELTLEGLKECQLSNEVIITHDGVEALDYLYCRGMFSEREPSNPVVVLLDLKMPRVDGLEVLQQIKSDEQLKMIPVVMLTSSQEEQDIVRSYQLGVNAYIVKPLDFGQFVNAIKQLGLFWAVINVIAPISRKRNTEVSPEGLAYVLKDKPYEGG